ncbi:hypothetical protein ColTof4_11879 [Colletotrichum tofieldiae]|nr:hypothetical protein ColTof3_03047 [Colletotrichum tofieldiae]GKT79456.1 hypothetical protein ColTof4_11879 [Colletotrichum tofieldiae]
MDRKIELEHQHCHNPSSYPEEGVIDGNELWSDARDICESLKGAGKRVSVEYSGFGSNGKGENGSKQHFAIWWKENCEFKSKERMGYGMKAYDPFENDENIEGESRCTMLLVENWKSCESTLAFSLLALNFLAPNELRHAI